MNAQSYRSWEWIRGLDAHRARAIVECGALDSLKATLHDGVLTDSLCSTGRIVTYYHLRFDGPPQASNIYLSN